jgi:hypothetical protein
MEMGWGTGHRSHWYFIIHIRSKDSWVVRVIDTWCGSKGVHSGLEEKRDICKKEEEFSKDCGSCSTTKTTPPEEEEPPVL